MTTDEINCYAEYNKEDVIHLAVKLAEQAMAKNTGAIPEGYALVPIKPTKEMLRAAIIDSYGEGAYDNLNKILLKNEEKNCAGLWEVMLSAHKNGGK